jgi:hypothetical protein
MGRFAPHLLLTTVRRFPSHIERGFGDQIPTFVQVGAWSPSPYFSFYAIRVLSAEKFSKSLLSKLFENFSALI